MRKAFIVAEVSANHLGSLDRALRIVEAAAKAGADAVKFQCWTPGSMCLSRDFRLASGPWAGWRLADLYERAATPLHWLPELFALARTHGLEPFASSFDEHALFHVERFAPRWHKIASFELIDLRLVLAAVSTGREVILSTGMASPGEVRTVVDAVREFDPGAIERLTLLHCVSGYPTPPAEANLPRMASLRALARSVGLSDHSRTIAVPVAATVLGATMIEAHLAIERGGLDDAFSLLPDEFAAMVRAVRDAEAACKWSEPKADATQHPLRRSLHAARDLPAGAVIGDDDIVTARPAVGAHPFHRADFIGAKLLRSVARHEPLTLDMIR